MQALGGSTALWATQPKLIGPGPQLRPRTLARQAGSGSLSGLDLQLLQQAAKLSQASAGLTAPHPNAACLLIGPDGRQMASAYQRASGSVSAEAQALAQAQGAALGCTAVLNLEPGDCHGDDAAVRSLLTAGVSRVVVGLQHPLPHLRGSSIHALRSAGVTVDVLGESHCQAPEQLVTETKLATAAANEALLHRAARRRPLSILKYAMTLDGKIATQQGHSAWVTSPPARAMVFDARARSDVVIVGGNTVRRDNPRLTTRRDNGHMPVRMVMSRTLDLPEDAALWDISVAPTIVATQRGARTTFQAELRAKGVEVVEFDFLTPEAVAEYCYARGFLQCFWECGGVLAAPCISAAVAHKLLAFIAPKVIGGVRAPTPVGDLGFVEMTQALVLSEYTWQQVGPDLMLQGYLPCSGGPVALAQELEQATSVLSPEVATKAASAATAASAGAATAEASAPGSGRGRTGQSRHTQQDSVHTASAAARIGTDSAPSRSSTTHAGQQGPGDAMRQGHAPQSTASSSSSTVTMARAARQQPSAGHESVQGSSTNNTGLSTNMVVPFYKAWDRWGALCNFTPHPITLPHHSTAHTPLEPVCLMVLGRDSGGCSSLGAMPQAGSPADVDRDPRQWASVEHYYQAQKFAGCAQPQAAELVAAIAEAGSPEEAARLGRTAERAHPELLTPDWPRSKVGVMLAALRAKFAAHAAPRAMLLATCAPPGLPARLLEASPKDFFWGAGLTGRGRNVLGQLLMHVRQELMQELS